MSKEEKQKDELKEEKKEENREQGQITIENIPENLKTCFKDVIDEVLKTGFRKKWILSSLFEIVLLGPYKYKETAKEFDNRKGKNCDGRIFLMKKDSKTYIYKEYFLFGHENQNLNNCKDKKEFELKQDGYIKSIREKHKDLKGFNEPDIYHWACKDQGKDGSLKKDFIQRDPNRVPNCGDLFVF